VCIGCKNFIEEPTSQYKHQDIDKANNNLKPKKANEEMADVEFEEVDFYSGMRLG
jgi:hypothetical protein